ncbi:hypothetical protein QM012_007434 [Aureobasidium pullulans]|uniref:Extracellular membrane protein CFEM domain-containing protein n=1 Tax=Aureobasidium pullulans TaxID=5580 RepID=A0ABR0TMZ9_AURPU
MKSLVALLLLVFACSSQALTSQQLQNATAADILQLAAEELPTCALTCTITTLNGPDSPCDLTDLACIKANKPLQDELSVCVKASCTIRESLTAKAFLQTLLGVPRRNKEALGTYTTVVVGGVSILAYLLRLAARLPGSTSKWGLDDWAITLAMCFVVPLSVCAYALNRIGMGKDMWFVSFGHITEVLKIFYFAELLYLTAIGLTKISMLLFYLRIFPDWKLRRAIYAMIGVCLTYIVVFVLVTALQCTPVNMAWLKWDGQHHGKCLDLNADGWASASINIILDLIVMTLPMKQLTVLNMSWQRKVGVIGMFLGGGFVTIVSILRLKYLIQFAHTENVTWDYLPVGYWSAVEAQVGIMVACAPAIRSLLAQIRQKLWPKPTSQPSYYEDTKNSSKNKSRADSARRSFGGSRMDNRSRLSPSHRKDDFVQIDEYEMDLGGPLSPRDDRSAEDSLEGSINRSYTPHDDIAPLAATAAPIGRGINGIMVQTDWSVGRESRDHGRRL